MSEVNPFEQYDENPFQDSAVIDSSNFQEPQEPQGGNNSNPFTEEKADKKYEKKEEKKSKFFPSFGGGGRERLYDEEDDPPTKAPAYEEHSSSSYKYEDEATKRKEEELRRKEQELEERARQLKQQEQEQLKANPALRVKNWPRCYPIIYHDIAIEIPEEWQKTVRHLYYSWILTVVCLGVNLLGAMCILIAGVSGKDFGSSILYFIAITPLSFFLWYRPVYNAFMKDTSFYFLVYFLFGGFHILFEFYMILGIQDTGGAGFINTIFLFSNAHIGEGIICLIALIFWSILTGAHCFLFSRVYKVYRARGHTIEEARNQAFTSAATSPAGRQAVSSAFVHAVNTQGQQN